MKQCASIVISVSALALVACSGDAQVGSPTDTDTPDSTSSDVPLDADDAPDAPDASADTADTDTTCPPIPYPTIPGAVSTTEGPVIGELEDGVIRWLGLRYAAPPVGDLRFRPPAAPKCLERAHYSELGPRCPQRDGDDLIGDEDCLTLNIWAPDTAPAPVLVFFHGGGHIQGSAAETLPGGGLLYDGQHLARHQDVVVVTVQYRLGALGWLVHPALTAEDEDAPIGNRGLLDQQAALRWLRDNVHNFGGDPDRVTIFGESAGAVDTALHLALPSSAGLFSSAIIQSGSPAARPLERALSEGTEAVAKTSCATSTDIAACLRALDTQALLAALPGQIGIGNPGLAQGLGNFGPVIDGRLLPEAPLALLAVPRDDPPSVIVGSNAEEMAELFALRIPTEAAYVQALRQSLATPIALATGRTPADVLDTLLATYPVSAYDSPQVAIEDVYTDLRFTCPAIELLRALHTGGHETRRYLFARRLETANGARPASHGRELPFVFGTWRNIPLYNPAPADETLSDQMMTAWATMGASIGSAVPDLETWPLWAPDTGRTLALDAPLSVLDAPREDRCAMWRELSTPP